MGSKYRKVLAHTLIVKTCFIHKKLVYSSCDIIGDSKILGSGLYMSVERLTFVAYNYLTGGNVALILMSYASDNFLYFFELYQS